MDTIEKARLTQLQELQALKKAKHSESVEILPGNEIKISWPDPMHHAAFHGVAGELVKLIEPHSETDPVALLVSFLSAFGSVTGNAAHFSVEADRHPARLFCTLVGESAKSRKGTSWGHIRRIFETIDPEWSTNVQSGLSSGEGLIWAVRDPITSIDKKGEIKVTDQGIKDKRLLVVESEFASTLKVMSRDGNTLSGVIRCAWDNGDLQSMTKNNQARATDAHISILGHVTRNELLKYLTSTEASNGFGNRFMWFCVKRSKYLPFGGNMNEDNLIKLIDKLSGAVANAKQVEEITWHEETKPLWGYIYQFLSEARPGLVGSMTARSEANVTRLALIYALLDKANAIMPIHLKAALAVWGYSERSSSYIFQDMTGNTDADTIIAVLVDNADGLTKTDISDLFGRHKSSQELGNALDLLIGLGKITKTKIPTEGRSKEVYRLARPEQRGSTSLNSLLSQAKYVEILNKYEESTPPTSNL